MSEKRIVINANSGLAGQVAERLLAETPIQVCARLFIDPDGTFAQIPAGRPDPLRPENRGLTIQAVQQTGADLAVAWDADADRCFFFDEEGEFVEGCYITALLAEHLLQKKGNGIIIFDPRAVWAVEAAVKTANGTPILNRCGHSFIKTRMQETDALFAGEASGHYYFRDNFYADNGMIPLLLMLEHLSATKISLAESVNRFRTNYPVSGEINFAFESRDHILNTIEAVRHALCCWGNHPCIEIPVDGLSVRFFANSRSYALEDLGLGSWRFNLRESNTEPLLRLNVEAVGCEELLVEKTEMLNGMLTKFGGKRDTKFRWEIGVV